jgi:hypothetical protein
MSLNKFTAFPQIVSLPRMCESILPMRRSVLVKSPLFSCLPGNQVRLCHFLDRNQNLVHTRELSNVRRSTRSIYTGYINKKVIGLQRAIVSELYVILYIIIYYHIIIYYYLNYILYTMRMT